MTPSTIHLQKTAHPFPVVGIGTSSRGLDALKKLLPEIDPDSGMAYIIAEHSSTDIQSNLSEILSQYSPLDILEINDDIDLVPNKIYIIPHNSQLIAQAGVLKLQESLPYNSRNNTIDVLFKSLADVYKSYTIGIILSGTAFDGTFGFKQIKEFGGFTIAQDPETATFKGMPQNAIDNDVVDYILAPQNIPSQLLLIQKSYTPNDSFTENDTVSKEDEEIIQQIITLILLRTGNDFRHYKKPTIRRRIARRMVMAGKDNMKNYYNFLQHDKAEQDLLFNDLLIPVTYFFRDPKSFDNLSTTIFPLLIQNITNNNLRIWVAGCATGEEAYSLAICLHEYLSQNNLKEIKVQIFASDISEKCITKARSAIYSFQDLQYVSEDRIRNYFIKRDGQYHISKVIRDMCIFAVHNFIKDPPFARIDLISCRNVLIYFNPFLQNKVFGSFHYSLKDKGILFLGKSETAANSQILFENIGKSEKIYIRKFAPGQYIPEPFKPVKTIIPEKIKTAEIKAISETDFKKITADILLSQYTPATVIINEHLDIVHFHGDTSPFLLPSPGKPNFNILKMAREGINFELRNALLKVKKEKTNISKNNIQIKKLPYLISFEVIMLPNDDDYLMLLFYKKPLPEADPEKQLDEKNLDQQRIEELEKELSQLREDIKRVTEEQQISFEELQTTNEELLSTVEELQALNEELQTSTEELESSNGELLCVNDELMDRQEQLISMRNYSESIIKTIREPLLIIDKDFIIKSANPAFYKYFKTTESETEGQLFFETGNCQWNIPEFKKQILKMISSEETIEDYKVETICANTGKKIMMINARRILNTKPDGMILLIMEDITDLVKTNELLVVKNSELQKYNNQLETFTTAASHDLQEPLRKIHMFSRRIFDNEKNVSDSGKHDLARIQFLISSMSQLINDLISYSRVNFPEKEYKKTDMNVLLKKTINKIKDTIDEKNALISVALLPELKVIPHQIQQLFINLIMNSIKYTKEGVNPQIKMESQQPSSEEIIALGGNPEINYAKICFTDNGIGFNKMYAGKIFDPFYRLHNKADYSGSGLGLTLAKKIVDNHDGFITASSEVNAGTTMCIYLPL